jgi:outer membrane protein
MVLSALQCAFRRTLAIVLAGALTATVWGQNAAQTAASVPDSPQPQRLEMKDYAQPRSHFPNPIGPYRPQSVAPPDLSNTPRIEQLMRDGKLMLSMNDAVALAMENNLDIAIQRYNLNIADTDVLRALAGGSSA